MVFARTGQLGRFVCSSYTSSINLIAFYFISVYKKRERKRKKKRNSPVLVYTAMAVLISFWRPGVDTDAVGERLLIENEQERESRLVHH